MGAVTAFDLCPDRMGEVYTGENFLDDLCLSVAGDGGPIQTFCSQTSELSNFVPKAKLRRVDHYSRMALLGAGRAMEDTSPALIDKENTGVIIATGYGALDSTFSFLDSYIDNGDILASPTHFSSSVHNAAAAHIGVCYGITGPSLTVSQFDLSFFSALVTAGAWLETGKTTAVLVGMVDAWCEVMGYCMHGFSLLQDKAAYSFGEGAAFFLLTRADESHTKYGNFEDISMGRFLDPGTLDTADILFSPVSTAPCGESDMKDIVGGDKRLWSRSQGFSPTDTGLDAVFALGQGKKQCCLKQGQENTYGKMMVVPAPKDCQ